MEYSDYTLDLETMGVNANCAIISIGAAAFNRKTEDFRVEDVSKFYVNVDLEDSIKHGLNVDASTIKWWMQQDKEAQSAFFVDPILKLRAALEKLSDWVDFIGGQDIPCWTHATFDAPILGNAYRTLHMRMPTHFRKQRDIRTLQDLMGYYKLERKGQHHNALDDAVFQAECIWGMLNGKGVRE